jgi:hypothetical protein
LSARSDLTAALRRRTQSRDIEGVGKVFARELSHAQLARIHSLSKLVDSDPKAKRLYCPIVVAMGIVDEDGAPVWNEDAAATESGAAFPVDPVAVKDLDELANLEDKKVRALKQFVEEVSGKTEGEAERRARGEDSAATTSPTLS